jgi:hypothetical protein
MILLGLAAAAAGIFYFHGIAGHLAHKLPGSLLSELRPALLFGGIILAALGVLGRNMAVRQRRMHPLAFAVVAFTFPLLALRCSAVASSYFNVFSSRQLARVVLRSPERNLTIYGYYYFRPGLPFYLRRPIGLVTADGDETTSNYVVAHFQALRKKELSFYAGSSNGPGAAPVNEPLLIDANELKNLSKSAPGPFLILVQNNEAAELIDTFGSMEPLWEAWKYSVWKRTVRRPASAVRSPQPR